MILDDNDMADLLAVDGDSDVDTPASDDDDNAAQHDARIVAEQAVQEYEAAVAAEEDARAAEGQKARSRTEEGTKPRTRTKTVTLSPALTAVLSDDDGGSVGPRYHVGIPRGAKTTYNYIAVLEATSPPIAWTERRRVIDELPITTIALRGGLEVALIHWNTKEGYRIFADWYKRNEHNPLVHDPLGRQMYALWWQGNDATEIATRLIGKQRHLNDMQLTEKARHSVRYFEQHHRELQRYDEPDEQPRQDAHRFNLRGSYSVGDKAKDDIISAIPALTTRTGEAPTSREIQAFIGAKSKIDRHLKELKEQGRVRLGQSGHGYEIVARPADVIPRARFRRGA